MKKKDIATGIIVSCILAFFIAPFASTSPDGLEYVVEQSAGAETCSVLPGLLPDYEWPGIDNGVIATGTAGVMGILIVFVCAVGLAFAISRCAEVKGT